MTPADSDDSFDFTDLGEALRGPNGGAIAAQVLDRLRALHAEARQRGNSGLAPADFARNAALADALAAAEDVMVGISSIIAHSSGPAPQPESKGN